MNLIHQTFLLFLLNIFDAVLTIAWVRSGVAVESNQLMATLLDIGNWPFLGVKIAIGTLVAIAVLHAGDRRISRYGVATALAIYVGLMGVHLFTGLSAFGVLSAGDAESLSLTIFGAFI
jgi:hypothetical protein